LKDNTNHDRDKNVAKDKNLGNYQTKNIEHVLIVKKKLFTKTTTLSV
jgi:hypothetical protein